jgi:hypothetical protein
MVKMRTRDIAKKSDTAEEAAELVAPAPIVVYTAAEPVDLSEIMVKMQAMADEISRLKAMISARPDYNFSVTRDVNGRIAAVKAVKAAVH